MVGQYYSGEEKEWEVVGMHRFYKLKQILPERPFSHASDRLIGGCDCGPPSNKFFGCLSRVPLNTISFG